MANEGFYVKGIFYQSVKLLGTGATCETWLVTYGNRKFAIKHILDEYEDESAIKIIQRNESSYKSLKSLDIPTPALLDVDYEHRNILKEYVEGDSAMMLVAMGKMTPEILEQLRTINERVDKSGKTIDYYSYNFVVSEGKLVYVDHDYNDKSYFLWDYNTAVERFWTRSPEFFEFFNRILIKYL